MIDVDFTGVFDDMLARMQGEDQRIKIQAVFHATPKELGEAAVEAAKGAEDASAND